MRKSSIVVMVCAAAFMLTAGNQALFAQRGGRTADTVVVRIASPLPRESAWGRTLDRIAAEWSKITGGQVRLNVLHGGTEGGETQMYRSLTSNTIQAAIFTTFGMSEIYPPLLTISAPFLIRNQDEFNVVMDEIESDIETRFNAGNYFIVAWSRAGFVNIFSREPVFTPDDLKGRRIASNAEAAEMNVVFTRMGFSIVEADYVDVGPMLATGQVVAVYQNPAAVAAFQLHNHLRNMLSVNIAPVFGGIVINQVTWRRIGELNPNFQQQLVNRTRQIAAELDQSMQKTVSDAISVMVRDGLTVNRPSAAQEQLWFDEIELVNPTLLGTTYDSQLYQRIAEILARHRAGR
ncbi:MAG: TRAP transporter substrate-binding protein DctP [Treponema sp.]|nr:TRAP transporter substrate-binding protein DctP [Treponema sp.]